MSGIITADSPLGRKISAIKDVVPPTTEQLEEWKPIEFAAYELLSVRTAPQTNILIPHPDGQRYLDAGEANLALWKVGESEPLRTFSRSDSAATTITAAAFSGDGSWFAAGDSDGRITTWRSDTGEMIAVNQDVPARDIWAIAIAPESNQIAVGHEHLAMVDLYSGPILEKQAALSTRLRSNKLQLGYLNDSTLVVSGTETQIWQTTDQTRTESFPSDSVASPSPFNRTTGDFLFMHNHELYRHRIQQPSEPAFRRLHRPSAVHCTSDGRRMAVADDQAVSIVDWITGRRLQVMPVLGDKAAFHRKVDWLTWLGNDDLLLILTSNHLLRIWGTPEAARRTGIQPMPKPQVAEWQKDIPPTSHQLANIIDLRTLPILGFHDRLLDDQANQFYSSHEDLPVLKTFYHHQLTARDWTQESVTRLVPWEAKYTKNDCELYVKIDSREPMTTVCLTLTGMVDNRQLPVFDPENSVTLTNEKHWVEYRTRADVFEAEAQLLRQISATGWTYYSNAGYFGPKQPRTSHFQFLNRGYELTVSIQADYQDPSWNRVRYSCSPRSTISPVPPDTDFVSGNWLSRKMTSERTIDEVRSFIDVSMTNDGWTLLSADDSVGSLKLRYYFGMEDVAVELSEWEPGTEIVYRPSVRIQSEVWDAMEVEAADFPIFDPVRFPEYDEREIRYTSSLPWNELTRRYEEAFAELGWKCTVIPGKTSLSLHHLPQPINVVAEPTEEGLALTISGRLRWQKPVPTETPQITSFKNWIWMNDLKGSIRL
ncbi:MAG: hypothetical protein KDA89_19325, partial [Planctomycetaceae bacterium]|nr:hypothetical protein [Planctomycetaceae bacterium]